MTTKEKIKKEIDALPDNIVEEIYRLINTIPLEKTKTKRLHKYKLNGCFDEIDIRANAYE